LTSTESISARDRLDLRLEAVPQSVGEVRRQIAEFVERRSPARVGDVALAVTEGTTNVVLHAYRGAESGPMRVVACAEQSRFVIVVRDYGCGMSPNPHSPGPGLGLSVIGAVASEMNIERPHDGGTRVRMHFPYNVD
jgi:anti-sigma regulatory factor (Ser/Thr protein kinase)